MCGINGIMSIKEIDSIESRIKKMNHLLAHRGPDAEGILLINNCIAFGHRRLSIIDTHSRANQPMISNSGRWVIVFNGEIYNYKDLKKHLSYDFKTNSDTEVILAYIENYGIESFIDKCNGMFAIALYDQITGMLYLIRDRLGVKPLYYTIENDHFIFSSEIKGILGSGLVTPKFNEDAIDEYLGNRYVRAPYTFFKNIFQVEPGSIIAIDKDLRMSKSIYWDLPSEFNYDNSFDETTIAEEFKDELIKAIERRLISDVPLGTYLSGGVDSSLITAITTLLLKDKINTYTVGFAELNEFDYAQIVADQYNTNHHRITMSLDDYFDLMDEIIYFKDAPLGVPNEVPLAFMSRILKEKITVVLSGEGADELLGGYGRIFRAPFDFLHNTKKEKDFYDYFIRKYEYVPRELRDKYLQTDKCLRSTFDDIIREQFSNYRNEENVFRFFHKYHVKGLLQRVDTTTMLAGVEARVPFLDYKLVEFSYQKIPYDLKLKWKNDEAYKKAMHLSSDEFSEILDIPKYLLKKIAYEYLPREVIERKKMGFPVPLNHWLNSLENNAKNLLKDAYWIKPNTVDELLTESKKNPRTGQIIWMLINVELFRLKYFE